MRGSSEAWMLERLRELHAVRRRLIYETSSRNVYEASGSINDSLRRVFWDTVNHRHKLREFTRELYNE